MPDRRSGLSAIFALAALGLAALPAAAQGIFGQKVEYASLTLHSGVAGEDGRRIAGLRMEIAPGWKTYWRSPGDGGIPPSFDWSGSKNLKAAEIRWPTPHVFTVFGARTIGYKNRMVLPLVLTPEDPARPIEIRLGMFYAVCGEICVPATADFNLSIPPGAPEDGAGFIRAALDDQPQTGAEAGLTAACDVRGADVEREFSARLTYRTPPEAPPMVVVEGPEGVWFGPVETVVADGGVTATGPVETEAGRWIDRSQLRLTVFSDTGATAIGGCGGEG